MDVFQTRTQKLLMGAFINATLNTAWLFGMICFALLLVFFLYINIAFEHSSFSLMLSYFAQLSWASQLEANSIFNVMILMVLSLWIGFTIREFRHNHKAWRILRRYLSQLQQHTNKINLERFMPNGLPAKR